MKSSLFASALLLAAAPVLFAQGPPPAQPDGPGPPPPIAGHPPMRDGRRGPAPGGDLHIMPMGMWWKRPEIISALALTTDQQKRIDDIFLKSRLDLIHEHATLQENELLLQPILDANPFDLAKAQVQIDKVADARAALEKTDAHMLLGIRAVLTPDQWTKLQARRRPGGPPGPGGPNGPRR